MLYSDAQVIRLGRWIGAVLLLIGGAVTAVMVANDVAWARGSNAWPTATATINRAGLVPATDRNDTYYVRLEYRYTSSDGVVRTGSKLRLESDPYERKSAEQMIAGLTPGQQRTVYYDPADPDVAVLEPGAAWTEYTPLVIPPLLLAVGAGLMVSLMKSQPRHQAPLMPSGLPPLVR
jgi:hypothetical protein